MLLRPRKPKVTAEIADNRGDSKMAARGRKQKVSLL
jgi:hypothetical protein